MASGETIRIVLIALGILALLCFFVLDSRIRKKVTFDNRSIFSPVHSFRALKVPEFYLAILTIVAGILIVFALASLK